LYFRFKLIEKKKTNCFRGGRKNMHKKKAEGIIALLITCFILLFAVKGTVFADGILGDLTGTEYLIIHDTTTNYDDPYTGGPTSITVENLAGDEIFPLGNTYSDIPNGSTIALNYVFDLKSGNDEETITYSYSESNYFDITLPEGIEFEDLSGVHNITSGELILATWVFVPAEDKITVQLKAAASTQTHIWGSIIIEGTFDELTVGESEEITLILGTEHIIFSREVLPIPDIIVEKEGTYNASDNSITWTVTVTPPDELGDMEGS
jgi:hypothetical protein